MTTYKVTYTTVSRSINETKIHTTIFESLEFMNAYLKQMFGDNYFVNSWERITSDTQLNTN